MLEAMAHHGPMPSVVTTLFLSCESPPCCKICLLSVCVSVFWSMSMNRFETRPKTLRSRPKLQRHKFSGCGTCKPTGQTCSGSHRSSSDTTRYENAVATSIPEIPGHLMSFDAADLRPPADPCSISRQT